MRGLSFISTLFLITLGQKLTVVTSAGIFQGCYVVDSSSRHFKLNPGDYDPFALTEEECSRACAYHGYQYAALEEGLACFCAAADIDNGAKVVDDSLCLGTCSTSGEHCGTATHGAIIYRDQLTTSLALSTNEVNAIMGQPVTIVFSGGVEPDETFMFGVDDGSGSATEDNLSDTTLTHTFTRPGSYLISVVARNSFTEDYGVVSVEVEAPELNPGSLDCPESVRANETFQCTFNSMVATAQYAAWTVDGELAREVQHPDPSYMTRGWIPVSPFSAMRSHVVPTDETTWVLPALDFTSYGWLNSVEFHASKTGVLSLLILRPVCSSGDYCPVDNQCAPNCDGEPGYPHATTYQDTCLDGEVYCTFGSRCLVEANVDSCPTPVQRYQQVGDPTVRSDYEFIFKIDVTASQIGPNFQSLGNMHWVEPGDVVGFMRDPTSALVSWVNVSEGPIELKFVGSVAQGSRLTSTDAVDKIQRHSLRVTIVESLFVNEIDLSLADPGNHTVSASLESLDAHPSYSESAVVLVCSPIENLSVTTSAVTLSRSQLFTVSVWIDAGDTVEYIWDWGDRTSDSALRQDSRFEDPDTQTHSYTMYGPKTITVTATNPCSSSDETVTVLVSGTEQPIQRHHYTISAVSPAPHLYPAEAVFDMKFTLNNPNNSEIVGTNVTVEISTGYYENTTSDLELNIDGDFMMVEHRVRFIGFHTARVMLSNPISEEVYFFPLESQEPLSPLSSFQPKHMSLVSSEEKLVPGYGDDQANFPLEYPVYFDPDIVSGSEVQYQVVDFGDSSPPSSLLPAHESAFHQYSAPGIYAVTVSLMNSVIPAFTVTKTINLYESISDIVITEGPRTDVGMNKVLGLGIGSLGYLPCIVVGFDDGGPSEYYGSETTCESAAGYMSSGYSGPITTTLVHRYDTAGTKRVILTGFNIVSNTMTDIFFYVGAGDCNSPRVFIRDGSQHYQGPRVVHRNHYAYLRGATYLDCSFTGNNKFWILARYYYPHNDSVIPGSEVNLTSLLPEHPLYIDGAGLSELRVPPYYLPIGYYKFTYNVVMDDNLEEPVKAFVHDYMEVRRGPIRAEIIPGPGTFITLGQEQSLLLNPGNLSRDLDQKTASMQQEFDEFRYYCKRYYEDWPLGEDSRVSSDFAASGQGGCFGQGAGRLNIFSGTFLLDGGDLLANMTYNIFVEVLKEGRISSRNITVLVVPGTVPQPFVEFEGDLPPEADGTVSLNPSEPLRLDINCDSSCNGTEIQWSFQIFNPPNYMEITGWEDYATGTATGELFLSDDFYATFVLADSLLRISANMVSPTGDIGTVQFDGYVTPPPRGGTCMVSPLEVNVGQSVDVVCSGWEDELGVQSYEITALAYDVEINETVDRDLQLYTGRSPQATIKPLPGDPSNLNQLQLRAVITNTRGVWTAFDLGFIQVHPVGRLIDILNGTVEEEYSSLLAAQDPLEIFIQQIIDGTELNKYTSQSTKEQNEQLAQLTEAASATGNGTADDPLGAANVTEEILRINQTKKVARIKGAYSRARLAMVLEEAPILSIDNAIHASAAAIVLTHSPEEQSQGFLKSTSNVVEKMVETVEKVGSEEQGKRVLIAGIRMLSIIGNMYQGSAKSIDDPIPVIDELEQSPDQSYTALVNKIDESTGVPTTQASKSEEDDAISELKKQKAQEIVNKLDSVMERTIQIIFNQKQIGEPATTIHYKSVSLTVASFSGNNLPATSFGQANGRYTIPPFCEMVSPEDCTGDPVNVLSLSLPDNPYNYVESSKKLSQNSNVMSLTYKRQDGSIIPVEDSSSLIEIIVPRPENEPPPFNFYNETAPNNETGMVYHSFYVDINDTSIMIQLAPENLSVIYVVYLKHEVAPTPESYDYRFFLPGNESSMDMVNIEDTADAGPAFKIFLDNTVIGNRTGKYLIGVSQVPPTFWADTGPIYFEQALDWAVGNASLDTSESYWLSISVSGCSFWITDLQTWGSYGCTVGPETDTSITQCLCNHLTSFSSTWIVPPTPLDFEYIFNNLGFVQNMTIYIATITSYTVFVFLFIWARRRDKKDCMLLGVTPLMDNKPTHKYMYEMTFLTGQRSGAGTDSKVGFIISGDQDETEVRTLEDDKRKILQRGAIDRFLLTTERPLGTLNYMRVWHDNSGQGDNQGWYLKYVAIRDLQTKERFYFIVNRWFSVVEDDGQVDRLVAVAGKEQMKEFSHVFEGHTSKNLNDGHLWISIYGRPAMSRFTRVQRVGCCMMALWLEMLVNIMWYKSIPPPHSAQAFNLGPISMSPAQISIGIQSMILVFPVTLLVVQFFRKSKPRKKRESRIKLAKKEQWERYKVSDPARTRGKLPPNSKILQQRRTYGQGPAGGTRPDPRLVHDDLNLEESMRGNDGGYQRLEQEVVDTRVSRPAKPVPKKPPFMLPWWFVIIAWILLVLATAAATLFTVFYGIQMGDMETKEWLASELVSFFTGVFVAQPIKVVLIAMLITLLFRSPNVDEEPDAEVDEETYDKSLDTDEEWLHDLPAGPVRERKIKAKPPNPENLEAIRDRRMKELQIYNIIKDIFFYFIFLFALMVVSYGNLDTWSYTYKANLENILVVGDGIHSFTKIKTKEQFWTWTKVTLLPNLEGTEYYNGDEDPSLSSHLSDQTSYILGYPVLRQLRVKPDLCEPHSSFDGIIEECNKEYGYVSEDESPYSVGWTSYNETTSRPEYIYTEAEDLDGYPYYAKHALYYGGGYLAKLNGDSDMIMNKIERLMDEKWIDVYSRALFIEMSLYNPQVNLFGVVNLIVEFLPTGGAHPFTRIDVVRLITVDQAFGSVYVGCLVVFFCFILFNLGKQLFTMKKQKREYYKSFWNLCDLSTIIFSIAACVVFFYRMSVTNDLLARFRETHGHAYIKLQYVAYWNEFLGYLLGWLIYICTLKFLKLLKFNRRIGLLSSTIRTCSTDLFYFAILFCVFFFAFAIAFYLILNTLVYSYSDFIYTSETLVSAILGKFHFKELVDANPTLGPLFFFLFMGTITFILVNMFLTIINEAFSSVKHDISKQSNEYEVVDFMVGRFKSFFGAGSKSNVVEDKDSETKKATKEVDPMDEFPNKVNQLLNSISSLYFDQEKFDDVMKGMESKKGGRPKAFISN